MASPEGLSVAGVVLAAGRSRRFATLGPSSGSAPAPKQLALFDGEPLLRRVCRAVAAASLRPVVVVLGYRQGPVRETLSGLDLRIVTNPDHATGQASSIRVGLDAVTEPVDAVVFVPADQPFVDAVLIDALISLHATTGLPIVVPRCGARPGAPVLFARSQFDELRALEGDEGGRQLIREHPERRADLELDDERPLLDIDTLSDLEHLQRLLPTDPRDRQEPGP